MAVADTQRAVNGNVIARTQATGASPPVEPAPPPVYVPSGSGSAPPRETVKRKPLKKILPPSDKPTRSEIVAELDGIAEMFGQGYEGRLIEGVQPAPVAQPSLYSPQVQALRLKWLKKA